MAQLPVRNMSIELTVPELASSQEAKAAKEKLKFFTSEEELSSFFSAGSHQDKGLKFPDFVVALAVILIHKASFSASPGLEIIVKDCFLLNLP